VCVLVGRRGADDWYCALARPDAAVTECRPSPTTTLGTLLDGQHEPVP
jgi:hypothetical protein